MKDKYLIISKGNEIDVDQYLESDQSNKNFKVLLQREAQNEEVQRGFEKESSKPEYLRIANKLGFNWEKNSVLGFMNYDYKAWLMMELVMQYSEKLVRGLDFPIYKMRGSNGFDENHEVVKAYADLFGDRLLKIDQGKSKLVMGYDASYAQFNLSASRKVHGSKLPYGHYSISDCYRNEQSGECMLLYRQRRFFMPDLHPYFKDLEEAFSHIPKMQDQILNAGRENGLEYEVIVEVNGQKNWDIYKKEIIESLQGLDKDYLVQIINDGKPRYWIINVDYKHIDKLNQAREIGCIQIDVGNAKRLVIEYQGENGEVKYPVIIHSAIPGGIERFIYALLDKYLDQGLPLWIQPVQCRLLPVSDKFNQFCIDLAEKYKDVLRIDIDDRSEMIGKKIKSAKDDLVENCLVIGEKELNQEGNWQNLMDLIEKSREDSLQYPYQPIGWSVRKSREV